MLKRTQWIVCPPSARALERAIAAPTSGAALATRCPYPHNVFTSLEDRTQGLTPASPPTLTLALPPTQGLTLASPPQGMTLASPQGLTLATPARET